MASANHCCIGCTGSNQRSIQKKCRLVQSGDGTKKLIPAVQLEDLTRSQLKAHCDQIPADVDCEDENCYSPVTFYDSDDAYLLKCRPISLDDDGVRTIFGIREAAMSAAASTPSVNVTWFEPKVVDDEEMNQYSCCCEHPRGSWKRQDSNKLDSNGLHHQTISSVQYEGNVRIIDLTKLQDVRKNDEAGFRPSFDSSKKIFHLLRSTLNCKTDDQLDELHCASPWKTIYREGVERQNPNDDARHDNPQIVASNEDQIVALLIKSPLVPSNTSSSWDELERKEYCELLDFRVGDAAPSYNLYSTMQLGTRDNFYEALYQNTNCEANDVTNCSSSGAVSLFVYRKLPPRDLLNIVRGEGNKYPGCLIETFLDHPEESDDDDGSDLPIEPILRQRMVSPPYLNHHEEFPRLLDPLLQRMDDIRREAKLIPQWTAWPERNHYSSGEENAGASWTIFPLCYTFPANDVTQRTFIDKTCAFAPATTALLQGIGLPLRTALFSRLDPNTKLGTHTGWSDLANYVIRVHIPLVVPQGDVCGTWVDGCVETQDAGRIVCFDDSKVHRAFNYSETEERIVLIIDLERPSNLPRGTAKGGHTDELDAFIQELTK
ncbi:aspartyl/asparaginyl beta-hydroxylase [Skeletonema marinoi]|uniref:Aspartyl/asparaginyl beta-hydroxylase n=1 Tax=Skeletonema marinoi TaxID=267567 RepID=A0AAD8YDZ3_9STRA|nr:aspartyl/asparaginyl beta-hydroxylase [Skeletonema marinoi]